ncbi:DEAD/DEAH box helicase [Auritidibacter ignavus]|uniref:ATP-dependent RNA helicase DeaD n=1 Tax=Auritidibacter ignavus TaxID=678932 RepID=A0AAJ6AJB3_9MICC|nr:MULTISPECIES: DEAD/DEAH box helicase [Auritidibacter]AXR72965.1 ATP-dependent RNA helicase [Auritidibacter sp. NML130574]PXA78221.1 ATP-dependent RNA helicase [Auritidibacter sp. NML100628]WGH93077.1 DEAD/DEAH box helicase [Auritidibacter ignavus]
MTESSQHMSVPENSTTSGHVTFSDLISDQRLLAPLEKLGYEKPSPIQAETIPLLLQGRDVVGLAQTGTGKTAAFALPALARLLDTLEGDPEVQAPRILVLAPTRELALQVAEAFTSYAAEIPQATVVPVYGGSAYGPQLAGLRRGAAIVVGTPGRVIDHLEKGSLDLSQMRYIVLDEADEMLRMGFAEEVDRILSGTPEDKQTALFSATMPRAIQRISGDYLNDPAQVEIAAESTTAQNIRQRYIQVSFPWKLEAMTRILETEDTDGIITFVRTRNMTEELTQKLQARGFRAAAISGDIPQNIREKTVEDLRAGRIDILVATDVAARGLDVERISHVINYDIPHDTSSYVHRIGRTGRAGRAGDAIILMTPRERHQLRAIEKATDQRVEEMQLPSLEEVNASRVQRFADQITATLGEEEDSNIASFRELVTTYVDEHNVAAVDVAAALAMMAQDGRPLFAEEPDLPPMKLDRGKKNRTARGHRKNHDRGVATPADGKATYWIAVGHKDRVRPGNIVGAIANEANLDAREIGDISIRPTHSLVELPEKLSKEQLATLRDATVAGRRLNLRLDRGRPEDRGGLAPSRRDRETTSRREGRTAKKKERWSKAKKRAAKK